MASPKVQTSTVISPPKSSIHHGHRQLEGLGRGHLLYPVMVVATEAGTTAYYDGDRLRASFV